MMSVSFVLITNYLLDLLLVWKGRVEKSKQPWGCFIRLTEGFVTILEEVSGPCVTLLTAVVCTR